ncbi:putative isomerase YddE [Pseudoalteromonas holothuriae]|uniref:Isomerase YddE n=1 Tax=Pseudoalteromonas holothuriae TaxID=2963714 RepID=A0ABN8UIZ0_9GAMM|nr:PhzF family phenazine biosynthesis protein [Pseudoalteromonas sp. CIP111951]CAH9049725.1 putative isomerase YddE [Pseudoalteromonas sp. CIP111951]
MVIPISAHIINAFVHQGKGGNPAAVIEHNGLLTQAHMQAIALYLGLSETAFVCDIKAKQYRVKFFTPTQEVDFCGHATLAVGHYLVSSGRVSSGNYTQLTKAGNFAVSIVKNAEVMMKQRSAKFAQTYTADTIATLFENTGEGSFVTSGVIQVVDTGLPDLLVPIKSGMLSHLKANEVAMAVFCDTHSLASIHVFELNTHDSPYYANTRNFSPHWGIPEECATGSASGALIAYLNRYEQLLAHQHVVFLQGLEMGRPSLIKAHLSKTNDSLCPVIGGTAQHITTTLLNVEQQSAKVVE